MTEAKMTRGQQLAFEKELCERNFKDFIRFAWQHIDPAKFVHNWHVDVLADHLQACAEGRINRLLINISPGTAKSTILVLFSAWLWVRDPSKSILCASYSEKNALHDSLRVKRLIECAWYQRHWPTQIMADQNAKSKFENDKMGRREARPFESLTGGRADCLRGDTIISTVNGPMTIRNIVENSPNQVVYGYDINTRRGVQRSVQAVARRSSPDFYRIHTASGRVVEATGDHRIYTDRGWVQTRLLSSGDCLVRMLPDANCADGGRDAQGYEANGGLLLPDLLNDGDKSGARSGQELRDLRLPHLPVEGSGQGHEVLFGAMLDGSQGDPAFEISVSGGSLSVRELRDGIPTGVERTREPLLLASVQGCGAFARHDGIEQSALERGEECEQADGGKRVSGNPSADHFAGSATVRDLREFARPSCPSYRSGHDEQRTGKSDHAVRGTSYPVARGGAFETVSDTVSRVERVSEATDVYDIQVEGVHNFFANGILVHNCLIIDDPHSVDDAKSAARRMSAVSTFLSAIPNRINDLRKSCIIVVMQRLHEDDVSGAILERPRLGYTHLSIPMIANDPFDRTPTKIGWVDHRAEGELMFPSKFPLEELEGIKESMGPLQFAGQYQQQPAPLDDGFFQRDWFHRFEKSELPDNLHYYMTSDHAPSGRHDYNVFRVWGVDHNRNLWLVDSFRRRCLMDEALGLRRDSNGKTEIAPEGAFAMIRKYQIRGWFPEGDSTWNAIKSIVHAAMIETRTFTKIDPLAVKAGDKIAKASGYQAMASMGLVHLPVGQVGDDTLEEYSSFPVGKNDDQVDADSGIARALEDMIPAYLPIAEKRKKRSLFDHEDRWDQSDDCWA